ncbi:MAG: VTT domain-containing protein [Patescibacteria group bacterium]
MRKQHLLAGSTLVLGAVGVLILLFVIPSYEKEITTFSLEHPLLAPLIIIVLRMIAIIIPPIPGGVVSFALIPILGWFWSYIYAMIGITLGAIIAFFIARKFREPVVSKFVPLQQLHTWEGKLSKRTEFLAFLGIRMTTGPIMDFISYVAGLSKISFGKFLLATLIAEIPSAPVYFLGGEMYKQVSHENGVYVGIGFLVLLGLLWHHFKDHEMFKKKK